MLDYKLTVAIRRKKKNSDSSISAGGKKKNFNLLGKKQKKIGTIFISQVASVMLPCFKYNMNFRQIQKTVLLSFFCFIS